MKILLILSLFLSLNLYSREIVVVSDLDETTRMANVENYFKAFFHLLVGVKPYRGMQAIYSDLKESNDDIKFYYLSSSYTFLYKGDRWINKYGFPKGVVFQRTLKKNSKNFKAEKLKEIYGKHPDAHFMFFGDNVERDVKIYENFVEENNLYSFEIFIRDALLEFPTSKYAKYFQTEKVLAPMLKLKTETVNFVNSLTRKAVLPNFLLQNLKERLVKECHAKRETKCFSKARAKVKEIENELSLLPL